MGKKEQPPDSVGVAWLAVLGERVRAARLAVPMSFREAVAAAGVSLSTIQRAESGTVDVGADILRKLADAYGVTVCDLLPPEGDPKGK